MNILLTSVGRRTYMINYFKDALKGRGEVHAANSQDTYSFRKADKSVITPLIYDNNYIDFLLDYCIKNKITAIIPLFDIDLPVLSINKELFKKHQINIIVSNSSFIKICNDKWLTQQFLTKNNLQTPQTFLSINDTLRAIAIRKVNYPFIIKPRWGMGSIGIFEAENEDELLILYKKVQKEINESYLKFESGQSPNQSVIIQEKLIGEEYGLDVFNNLSGEHLACVPKRKIGMRGGETDSAEIIDNILLSAIGIQLSTISKHIGNLDVDCFLVKNSFYILEMNCRFGGQYPFSHLSGVDFPKAIIDMLNGKQIKKSSKILKAKAGVIGVKEIQPEILRPSINENFDGLIYI